MRALVGICLLAAGAVLPSSAAAQETEALRRELEQMRKQFETMKDGYEKSINQLSERLKTLESKPPQPPAAAPAAVPAVAGREPTLSQAQPGVTINPLELARPREPYALYERRGAGQLLFDMGIAGDFIGNLTQQNVKKNAGGTFSGLENRFFPREVEVSLFGQIDPYARAEVRFEAGEEERGGEVAVHLAEAFLELMTLPFGTQARMGQMRNRFGLTNVLHEHDLPFIDRPNVMREFFGDEGLVEKGLEATWVAPLPIFLEVLGGVFNGDNETAFGRGNLKHPLVTGRVRTFFELGDFGAIQLGASIANGQTPEQLNNQIIGFDAKYKYRPEGWQHALFTVAGEYLHGIRQVLVTDPEAEFPVEQKRTRERSGWYAYGEVQPFRVGQLSRWSAGFRYDWTQYPVNPGKEWAVQPYLSFMPSEFLRFRLGYKHTERSERSSYLGFEDNGGSARKVDEILFQATFILGAHPAHPF
jgi:hypothetical protein